MAQNCPLWRYAILRVACQKRTNERTNCSSIVCVQTRAQAITSYNRCILYRSFLWKRRWTADMFCGMTNYFLTLRKEEWLENLRAAGEGYNC